MLLFLIAQVYSQNPTLWLKSNSAILSAHALTCLPSALSVKRKSRKIASWQKL
jgi:hypothetical protein